MAAGRSERDVPRPDTIEAWCRDFVTTLDLARKLSPPAPPDVSAEASWESDFSALRIAAPGRPPELSVVERSAPTPTGRALARPEARARLLHTFVHHELQAAELFAWAVLAFPETPRAFRSGLVRLCREELAHMHLYLEHMTALGTRFGDHPVRDWFWDRVGRCESAASFVGWLGIGLEGANLEHSTRFAAMFRAVGDERGAAILEQVEADEVAHVAFAVRWFERLSGEALDFERWSAQLPPPLTPSLMQGQPMNRAARRRAGFSDEFLARLAAAPPTGARRRP